MKYMAIFDDSMLSIFRLDDEGLTLVLTDKAGSTRAVRLKPLQHPTITTEGGASLYLTQGHIDCLREYEKIKMLEEAIQRVSDTFSNPYDINAIDFSKDIDKPSKYQTKDGKWHSGFMEF